MVRSRGVVVVLVVAAVAAAVAVVVAVVVAEVAVLGFPDTPHNMRITGSGTGEVA